MTDFDVTRLARIKRQKQRIKQDISKIRQAMNKDQLADVRRRHIIAETLYVEYQTKISNIIASLDVYKNNPDCFIEVSFNSIIVSIQEDDETFHERQRVQRDNFVLRQAKFAEEIKELQEELDALVKVENDQYYNNPDYIQYLRLRSIFEQPEE